ncbi:MAG: hypothetical protein AAB721_02475 [Patescibacteria group bacterium]
MACKMEKKDIIYNFEKALEAEARALEICQMLDSMMKDDKDRDDIKSIAMDEEKHIKIAKKMIEIVNNFYKR